MRKRVSMVVGPTLVVLALFVSACGSSSSSSSSAATSASPAASTSPATSTGSSSSASGGLAEAQAAVKQFSQPPTLADLKLGPPLPKAPPKGKVVDWLGSPIGVGVEQGKAVAKAAQVLGWTYKSIPETGEGPTAFTGAWSVVLQNPPSGVIEQDGADLSFIKSSVDQATAKGIAYASGSFMSPVNSSTLADAAGPVAFTERGQLMADWITADSDGKADTVFFSDNQYPLIAVEANAFQAQYEKVCPGCKLSIQQVNAADIGTKIPGQVTGYMQANPNTKYIALSFGDLATGIPAALKGAGLTPSQVKIISGAGDTVNYQDIASGAFEVVSVSEDLTISAYREVDALARYWEGESPSEIQKIEDVQYPYQFITKATVQNPSQPYHAIPGEEAAYYKLWHVGS
jgi:ABC-type sugar transport system substrate-binding protein